MNQTFDPALRRRLGDPLCTFDVYGLKRLKATAVKDAHRENRRISVPHGG